MGCRTGNCGKARNQSPINNGNITILKTEFVDFTKKSTNRAIVRAGNKSYSILSPLVKIKPPMGYGLNILVNGHQHTIEGRNAREVVNNVIKVYADNQIEISDRTAWYNANIAWLKQLSVRHGYTTIEEMAALESKPQILTDNNSTTQLTIEDPNPDDWGASAWCFLGAFVAQGETMDNDQFWNIISILVVMLGDDFIGCDECADHFKEVISLLPKEPTPLQAARWMFETMNKIRKSRGKVEITWEQAVRKHRWENLEDA